MEKVTLPLKTLKCFIKIQVKEGLHFEDYVWFPGDDVVPYKFGEKSSQALISHGFKKTTFKAYTGLGHYTIPQEMNELCSWLTSNLGLEGWKGFSIMSLFDEKTLQNLESYIDFD